MELLETEIPSQLFEGSEEYKELFEQHRLYEERLEQISHRRPFTDQDWFEEAVVKKRKLCLKDRMVELQRAHLKTV